MNRTMRRWTRWAVGALLVLGMTAGWNAALAQNTRTRTLSIQNGKVTLDGRLLSSRELPQGLDLRGVQMNFVTTTTNARGQDWAVVTISGKMYVLGEGRLVAAPSVSTISPASPNVAIVDGQPRVLMATPNGGHTVYSVPQPSLEEPTKFYGTLSPSQVPLTASRQYMESLRKEDRELYERLNRERALEGETVQLALQIRTARTPAEKRRLEESLKKKLEESFELKQQNRREEIRKLEAELDQLRGKLRERERLRAQIVEQRLRELTGQEDPSRW